MTYGTIQSLLDDQLQTVSNLPTLQLENTANVGVAGQPFARATLLPRQATQLTVGINGSDSLGGLYQIDLFYPLNAGSAAANTMADAVCAVFGRGTILIEDDVRVVIRTASRLTAGRVEQFYSVPVVVEWLCVR